MTKQNCKPNWNLNLRLNAAKQKDIYTALHLAAMHTLPCTLAICAGMAAAQIGMFVRCINHWDATVYGTLSYAALVSGAQLTWLFRIALALVGTLCLYGGFGKGSPAYLVHRLRLCPALVGLGWAAGTALSLLMLWGAQVLVLGGCYLLFTTQASALTWGSHTFLIETYRDGFLHAVLPMGDAVLWVRNLFAIAALSLASGSTTLQFWRGKQSSLGICALLLAVFFFESIGTYSAYDILLIVAFGWVVLIASAQLKGAGREIWEEEA